MATKTIVMTVCDLCGGEEEARTHEISVDGKAVELEACPKCWKPTVDRLTKYQEVGRRKRRKRAKATA